MPLKSSASVKPNQRIRAASREPVTFTLSVTDWWLKVSFGFMATSLKTHDDLTDLRLLRVVGLMQEPIRFKDVPGRFTFSADPALDRVERSNGKQLIGSIHATREHFSGDVVIPNNMLAPLIQTLAAGRIQTISLHGPPVRYRSSDVINYSIGWDRAAEEDE